MLPTLRPGDCLLVRRGAPVRPGDVVVGRFEERPGVAVVKRAVTGEGTRWVLAAENPAVVGHGLTGGRAVVEGRVVLRYWPLPVCRIR